MKWVKFTLVVFGAVVVTAFGIDAADTIRGENGTLLSQLASSGDGGCPEGMAEVQNIPGVLCIDMFEATPHEKCPVSDPTQILQSRRNVEDKNCGASSIEGSQPWRFITRDQAIQMCARAGKRLPTSAEWFAMSAGMADIESSCNVSSNRLAKTGEYGECSSYVGAYDLVGNVWEWVSDDVIDGMYNARKLPDSGYIAQVDAYGIATVSSSTASDLFEADYFWSNNEGAYGMIRGGYYDSDTDAGLYSVHADTPPTTAGPGIGFRCVI